MTDLEMTRFAAKACGYEFAKDLDDYDDLVDLYLLPLDSENRYTKWNPRDDDGDALRLAVRLWFNIKIFNPSDPLEDDYESSSGMVEIWREDDEDPLVVEYFKTAVERLSATRRAITRAAAEIGKAIP